MRFVCDGSLGGLARWLRAAGYDTAWRPGLAGAALLEEARATGALVLTSDHEVFLRREVVSGRLPALQVSSRLGVFAQLRHVLRTLSLPLGEPRCMACGGVLQAVAKESVRERIPPRTARWKDEFFACRGCDRLLWQGTHWERIAARLRAAAAP
jgi:uncharacterized protein with PIN domain